VLLFPPATGTGTGAGGSNAGVNNAATSTSSANSGTAGTNGMPHYGCLRRVVKRGPPYDFSVDRRCVWKFCLFEQFSDNNIKLSVKDRNAKKVSFLFDAVLPKLCPFAIICSIRTECDCCWRCYRSVSFKCGVPCVVSDATHFTAARASRFLYIRAAHPAHRAVMHFCTLFQVMETATMAMKLSQLNREGARTHIHSHTHGHDLPPLKSGACRCCVLCVRDMYSIVVAAQHVLNGMCDSNL
jgi:hypothetical protein